MLYEVITRRHGQLVSRHLGLDGAADAIVGRRHLLQRRQHGVAGLTIDDFEVFQDGQRRELTNFLFIDSYNFV